jgi:hypothetical protein
MAKRTSRVAWGLVAVLTSVLAIIARREDGPQALVVQQALMAQGVAGASVWLLARHGLPDPRLRIVRWLAASLVILMAIALGGMWLSPRGYAFCGGVQTLWAPRWTVPAYFAAYVVATVQVAALQPLRASVLKWIAAAGFLAASVAGFIAIAICL